MFSSPFSSRSKADSQELKLLQDQIKSLQEMYIAACEARDDLQENLRSLKGSLKLKADEAEHSGARVRELEIHTSQLTQRLRDATDLLERRGVAERAARDELRRLEAQHSQGANTYIEQLDTLRSQIRDAEEALQKRQQEYDSVRRKLGMTERVSEAGMAQIRQLASLLTQQQQQVLPPFLSQLQSPAPRVAPSPSPSIHGATTSRLALSDEGGEAAGGVSGSVHHSMPHSSSSSIAAASSSAEDDAAATKLEGAETAGEECSAAQEPLTPTSLRTPLPQSPAVTDSDGDEAIKKGIENNVSGSSDDNGSDA